MQASANLKPFPRFNKFTHQNEHPYPRPQFRPPHEETNIVFVSERKELGFYMGKAKWIFKQGKFDVVEIHAAGDENIYTATKVYDMLTRYEYAVLSRIKTKTLVSNGQNLPKLILHLTKSQNFDEVFDKYEVERTQRYGERPTHQDHYRRVRTEEAKNEEKEEEAKATPMKSSVKDTDEH